MELAAISRKLARQTNELRFKGSVAFVYNPLDYARAPHEAYLEKFGAGPKQALFIGMNPGPFGMAQTGVPFGDVRMVRDWMGIDAPVRRPADEHPKRPIEGFACRRSEVSGSRFWGWAKERFGTPARFFQRFFVVNYCPLLFLEASGKNRTPADLSLAERKPLEAACDEALLETVRALDPRYLIGVGAFAEACAARAAEATGLPFGSILHPSPASPLANRGWAARAEEQLSSLGVLP